MQKSDLIYWLCNRSDVVCLLLSGRNLKEWLQEQFCDKPLEQCEDMRLHNAAYVGDLETIRTLLQEDSFKRWDINPRTFSVLLQDPDFTLESGNSVE